MLNICFESNFSTFLLRTSHLYLLTLHTIVFQMENIENSAEKADCIDLENILKAMDSLSKSMDELVLQSQLKLCDLIICVGHPDKLTSLTIQEPCKQQQTQA